MTYDPAIMLNPEDLPMEDEYYSGEPDDLDESELVSESMDDFKDEYLADIKSINSAALLSGSILKITDSEVYVDFKHKTEGVVPLSEFTYDKEPPINGDPIEVVVVKYDENDGSILLSRNKARLLKAWDLADEAFQEGGIVEARVSAKVKGGLQADYHGLKAFIPGSLMSLQQEYDLEKYINKRYEFRIIEFNRRRRNMVLSRKAILEVERKAVVSEILQKLESGKVVPGVVKNITDYGAFVSIEDGQIDGLLHKADMSWAHVRDMSKFVNVGDELTVKILNVDKTNEKISLGVKQLTGDPWLSIDQHLRVGEIVKGRVRNITHFGAFVEVTDGIEGLVHISDMSWTERIRHPKELCDIQDELEVRVLSIDPDERKIALGMKQVHPDPWSLVREEYQIGEVVTGHVKNLADFGAFIELKEGVEGLIHISDLSWVGRVKHPSDVLTIEAEVEVKILDMDPDNKKISLGLKQVNPDPWELAEDNYIAGTIVRGKVKKLTDFGAFIELKDGIEGLVHISDFSWTERVENPSDYIAEGSEIDIKILEVNKEERRISLGLKQMADEPWSEVAGNLPIGTVTEGVVNKLTNFGAFIEIGKGVEGLLHVSDFSWTERINHPSEKLSEGDTVKVKVLGVDPKERKLSLGIKQLDNDPVSDFLLKHPVDSRVDGEVVEIVENGAMVKIDEDIIGFVHVSQLSKDRGKPEELASVGQKVLVKVLDFDKKERRIKLSIRQATEDAERQSYEKYSKSVKDASDVSIGDMLGSDLKAALQEAVEDEDE